MRIWNTNWADGIFQLDWRDCGKSRCMKTHGQCNIRQFEYLLLHNDIVTVHLNDRFALVWSNWSTKIEKQFIFNNFISKVSLNGLVQNNTSIATWHNRHYLHTNRMGEMVYPREKKSENSIFRGLGDITDQSPVSISDETSYRKISWGLEAAREVV